MSPRKALLTSWRITASNFVIPLRLPFSLTIVFSCRIFARTVPTLRLPFGRPCGLPDAPLRNCVRFGGFPKPTSKSSRSIRTTPRTKKQLLNPFSLAFDTDLQKTVHKKVTLETTNCAYLSGAGTCVQLVTENQPLQKGFKDEMIGRTLSGDFFGGSVRRFRVTAGSSGSSCEGPKKCGPRGGGPLLKHYGRKASYARKLYRLSALMFSAIASSLRASDLRPSWRSSVAYTSMVCCKSGSFAARCFWRISSARP